MASLNRSPGASHSPHDDSSNQPSIPIDTLVNHLVAAKRSLSSMTLVLRANELANHARGAHEDTVILAAQTAFLRHSILDQVSILVKLRRSLQATYDWGKKDFKKLVRSMDESDGDLEGTMCVLRDTIVQSGLRPPGEEKKSLLDFVDELNVHKLRDAMKRSIEELQGIQQGFDSDLLRFDTDIRNVRKALPTGRGGGQPAPDMSLTERLDLLFEHSASMAHLLASLNNHFDMCVTAIRTTEGAVAHVRRMAAEVTQSQEEGSAEAASISGAIAEQESNVSDLEPKTAKDRAEMLRVVVQDAAEVDDVVREMQEHLIEMEQQSTAVLQETHRTRQAYMSVLDAYAGLGEVGNRLSNYLAASEDFKQRWKLEKDVVFDKLQEMRQLKDFYDRYASAYDTLILEVERRKSVEDRVRIIWQKAQDSVDKILRDDETSREAFRQDVGEYLPTDLWTDIQGPSAGGHDTSVMSDHSQGDVNFLRRSLANGLIKRKTGQEDATGEETPRTSSKRT